jgi:hypothetical protein
MLKRKKRAKISLEDRGLTVKSYPLSKKAIKTIKQVSLDKDIKYYKVVEMAIRTSPTTAEIYKRK